MHSICFNIPQKNLLAAVPEKNAAGSEQLFGSVMLGICCRKFAYILDINVSESFRKFFLLLP